MDSANPLANVDQITLVGTGLLGGSIGLGLRAAGWTGRRVGVGRRKATLDLAMARDCVDEVTTDMGRALAGTGLVILCTPVGTFQEMFVQIARYDHDKLVITDVGSTKQQVCGDARRLLPDPTRFVGSHPMAGGEQHGPQHARADLFRNRPCIITDDEQTRPYALGMVKALWRVLGMRLIHRDARTADEEVARISHLPHAVAMLLVELADRLGGLDVASTGFRDTTRVASGDPKIWLDIFASNRLTTAAAIEAFSQQLARFRQILIDDDQTDLLKLLGHCKQVRDHWLEENKNGKS